MVQAHTRGGRTHLSTFSSFVHISFFFKKTEQHGKHTSGGLAF